MKRLPEPFDVTDPNEDYAASLVAQADLFVEVINKTAACVNGGILIVLIGKNARGKGAQFKLLVQIFAREGLSRRVSGSSRSRAR